MEPEKQMPSPETTYESVETAIDDIDELQEQLAAYQIMSEERQDEILERIETCHQNLASLSQTITEASAQQTAAQAAENPLLSQLLSEVANLRTEVTSLKSSLDSSLSTQTTQSESTQEVTISEPITEAENASAEGPREADAPQMERQKKRRFRLL